MSSVEVRRARLVDVTAIVDILNQDYLGNAPHPYGPGHLDAFEEIDRDPNALLVVAELDGAVVGTLQITFLRHLMRGGCRVGNVESVHVAQEHRSRGIGEAMMRFAIGEARRRGAIRLQLTSNKVRRRAHAFYQRLGFEMSHEGFKLYL